MKKPYDIERIRDAVARNLRYSCVRSLRNKIRIPRPWSSESTESTLIFTNSVNSWRITIRNGMNRIEADGFGKSYVYRFSSEDDAVRKVHALFKAL